MTNTSGKDPISLLLDAAFGAGVLAEGVCATEATDSSEGDGADGDNLASGSAPSGTDGSSTSLPHWWKKNLDGSWRKTCQSPARTGGEAFGETKRHETDLDVMKALHAGAENLVEVVAATGYVKVTCVRSLERLVEAGRVVQSKAAPTGKRGRPAFVYRPVAVINPSLAEDTGANPSTRQDPVFGDDSGIDETSASGADLRSTVVPDPDPVDAGASTRPGAEE
jgi:hypothetical protein